MTASSPESADLEQDKIVAVGLLTAEEVRWLGGSLKRVYPLRDDGSFEDLLRKLDRESGSPTASS